VEPLTADAPPLPAEGGSTRQGGTGADAGTDARHGPHERRTAARPEEPLGTLELGAFEGWRIEAAVAGLVAVFAFGAYASHLLRSVGFWDTAIFQAAAPTLGLTHPTGFPTYLLLGWAFTNLVPIGDPAYRMDLLSAVISALAVATLYLVIRWIGATPAVAAIGALTFGLLQPFWRTAGRADPHTLHVLLALALILLALEWNRRGRPHRWLLAMAFLFGLALGNHLLMVLMGPALAGYVLLCEPGLVLAVRRIVGLAVAFLTGAGVYLYVPLRAASNPPIHHDFAPTTWDLFWRYVLGSDFRGSMGFLSLDGPGNALGALPAFIRSLDAGSHPAIAMAVIGLALVGLIALARSSPRAAFLLLASAGLTLYAALNYQNADIERYYFLPVAILVALAALGAQLVLWSRIPAVPSLQIVTPALAVVPIALLALNSGRVDNPSAECYAQAALQEVKPNAVVMSWWSYSTPLWYERFVAGERPDVEVFNGIDAIPGEVDRRFGQGRPIYVIQPSSTLARIQATYALTPLNACGVTLYEVRARG